MHITNVKIKYFRSIEKIEFSPSRTTVVCGTNSSGKSNILRALRLAFLPNPRLEKLSENITNTAGPNATCKIELQFNAPTASLAAALPLPANVPWIFTTSFRRSGIVTRTINGTKISDADFSTLCDNVLLIYVPAIRDIAVDGLTPFKLALVEALKNQKGATSLANIDKGVRDAIDIRARALLTGPNAIAKEWLDVKSLHVDTSEITIREILPSVGVQFLANGKRVPLSKLGTGHQSAVIIKLYRELGAGSNKAVLYLFEEPDNHLHPTSIRVVADELVGCTADPDSQVFLTTHSPYLLNQFDFNSILPISINSERMTVKRQTSLTTSQKDLRIALGKFGLRLAEALLAKRVIVVEGPNDVTVIRTLIELHKGSVADRQDILVVPANGKAGLAELCPLLQEIGADWRAVVDWDAVDDTNMPIMLRGLTPAQKTLAITSLNSISPLLNSPPLKPTKIYKQLQAMIVELQSAQKPNDFENSIAGKLTIKLGKLSVAQRSALKTAVKKKQVVIANRYSNATNLFLWKSAIEAVVVPPSAVVDAEAFLVAQGKMTATAPGGQQAMKVASAVKGLAHEPATLHNLICNLWQLNHYKHKEAVRGVSYLCG